MKIFLDFNDENRILGYGSSPMNENNIEMDLPPDHDFFTRPLSYKLVDGALQFDQAYHDELVRKFEEESKKPSIQEEVANLKKSTAALLGSGASAPLVGQHINKALRMFAKSLPADQILEIAEIFPQWEIGVDYKVNDYVKDGTDAAGKTLLYQVVQPHRSQADWRPAAAASLFKRVAFSSGGTAVWIQPTGAHDAYKKGAVVQHKTKNWISDVDGNVWEPGVYGWTMQAGGAR